MKNFLILGAIAGLAACGTTTNPPTTTPPPLGKIAKDMTAAITGTVNAIDADGSAVTISIGSGTPLVNLTRLSVMDTINGNFAAAVTAVNVTDIVNVAYSGATASGGMTASLAGEYTGTGGVTYARTGQTTLPTSGTGSYSGEYVGLFGEPVVAGKYVAIRGLAKLDVTNWNSSSPSIDGTITSRVAVSADGTTPTFSNFADVALSSATIDASGFYSGAVTGGARLGGLVPTGVTGTYVGMIGGANGTETAGGVTIGATYGGIDYTEFGAFLAN